ncbi:hypothetical protein CY34DRAFT_540661 [Suillus luteus UH-Slu-Lm8-n1]|uniref:Uncharacterized protein n=1 Tax=Suillus luteus UH-Slu-Lm8-n1 TaxID=930992 RepID=A0A0D0B646_9AGAM|nr:hypothetical protein CY34DRAFT_540661 [Suillus luteus UH-Slu-Lm8-n1]
MFREHFFLLHLPFTPLLRRTLHLILALPLHTNFFTALVCWIFVDYVPVMTSCHIYCCFSTPAHFQIFIVVERCSSSI